MKLLPLNILDKGIADYTTIWDAMRAFTEQRDAQTMDEIWLLEHPPVFTQGQAGKPEHILRFSPPIPIANEFAARRETVSNRSVQIVHEDCEQLKQRSCGFIGDRYIPLVQTDRGGQVTYHGPGQLIAYCLLNLKQRELGVRELVSQLEQAVLTLLNAYQIPGHTDTKAPGVYVANGKIGSLGLRVRKHCSYHGLSLNVNLDLSPFHDINPCGYRDLNMVQLADYYPQITISEVKTKLRDILLRQFTLV